jgi:thioredoxin-related protein
MRHVYAVLIAGLCIAVAAGCGEKGVSKKSSKATADAKPWVSFNEGMARAAKEKKQVVIDFYTSWCRWCKVMDRETFSDPDVKKYLAEHFVAIRVDAEDKTQKLSYQGEEYSPFSLGRRFGVRGFPSLAYLDREGELVTVVPGFVPAKTFLPFLQYMQKECYKQQMTFDEYMQRKGGCDTTGSL